MVQPSVTATAVDAVLTDVIKMRIATQPLRTTTLLTAID